MEKLGVRPCEVPVFEARKPYPDVVVVGAGITGLSIAWRLLGMGARVRVVERSGVAAGASGVQPGGVRQQWSTPLNCTLARESVAFYRAFSRQLESSADPVLEACGYLFVADSEAALEVLRTNVSLQNELGIPSRILSPAEVGETVPGIRVDRLLGASYCGEDGYFDKPQAVVEAFARRVETLGGEIVIGTVVELAHTAAGWRTRLADGQETLAPQVVVAAGCDTRTLLEALEVELPIEPEPRYLFLSEPIRERLLEPLVVAAERRFAAKQLASGRVLASDLGAVGEPANDQLEWRATVNAGIRSLVPILEYVSFPILAEGMYDVTPDHQPILDSVAENDGLWVAAGFSGHGFMLAPAVSRLMAEAIAGTRDSLLDHFSLARFAGRELHAETQVV